MSPGGRLGVVLGLLAGVVGGMHWLPPVRDREAPALGQALPSTLGRWTATDGVPEAFLPSDGHEAAAVRRTYRNGERVAWISVARFTHQDEPLRRPFVQHISPETHVALIEPAGLTMALDGARPTTVSAWVIHRGDRQHVVVYWHQIGGRVYGSEYWYRWALGRRILLARRGDSLLVRIAVPVDPPQGLPPSLSVAAELGPPVYAALADAFSE
jgi:EpsI family protein